MLFHFLVIAPSRSLIVMMPHGFSLASVMITDEMWFVVNSSTTFLIGWFNPTVMTSRVISFSIVIFAV